MFDFWTLLEVEFEWYGRLEPRSLFAMSRVYLTNVTRWRGW